MKNQWLESPLAGEIAAKELLNKMFSTCTVSYYRGVYQNDSDSSFVAYPAIWFPELDCYDDTAGMITLVGALSDENYDFYDGLISLGFKVYLVCNNSAMTYKFSMRIEWSPK